MRSLLARLSCVSSSCQSAFRRSCHTRFLCITLKLVRRSNACISSDEKHQNTTNYGTNMSLFCRLLRPLGSYIMSTTPHPRYLCVSLPIGIAGMRRIFGLDRGVLLIELSECPYTCASVYLHGSDSPHIRPGVC